MFSVWYCGGCWVGDKYSVPRTISGVKKFKLRQSWYKGDTLPHLIATLSLLPGAQLSYNYSDKVGLLQSVTIFSIQIQCNLKNKCSSRTFNNIIKPQHTSGCRSQQVRVRSSNAEHGTKSIFPIKPAKGCWDQKMDHRPNQSWSPPSTSTSTIHYLLAPLPWKLWHSIYSTYLLIYLSTLHIRLS